MNYETLLVIYQQLAQALDEIESGRIEIGKERVYGVKDGIGIVLDDLQEASK